MSWFYKLKQSDIVTVIISIFLTTTGWFFSNYYSIDKFGKNILIQLLFYIAINIIIFNTLDKLINPNYKINTIMIFILILDLLLLFIAHQIFIITVLLLSLIPISTTFIKSIQYHNGIGLISYSTTIGFLIPISFYFLQNNIISNFFIKFCVTLSLIAFIPSLNLFFQNNTFQNSSFNISWLIIIINVLVCLIQFHNYLVIFIFALGTLTWLINLVLKSKINILILSGFTFIICSVGMILI